MPPQCTFRVQWHLVSSQPGQLTHARRVTHQFRWRSFT